MDKNFKVLQKYFLINLEINNTYMTTALIKNNLYFVMHKYKQILVGCIIYTS